MKSNLRAGNFRPLRKHWRGDIGDAETRVGHGLVGMELFDKSVSQLFMERLELNSSKDGHHALRSSSTTWSSKKIIHCLFCDHIPFLLPVAEHLQMQ